MKKTVFFGAAAAAMLAAGVAHADGGYVGVAYSNIEVNGLDSTDAYGAEAAVALEGTGGVTFEIDAAVVDSTEGGTGLGASAHVYHRNDSYLIGGFAGISDANNTDGVYSAGVEANSYMGNFTLAGALAYVSADEEDASGYGANVEGRFFVSDNFRLQGNLGYASLDIGGFDETALSYGVSGEYKFGASPFSVALAYARSETEESDLEADQISVGVRYNWGESLLSRDRSGPSQASLVNFGSAFGF